MCVIIYKPENISISKKTLSQAFRQNPDGIGFALWNKKTKDLEVVKGIFTVKDLLIALNSKDYQKKSAVIHFRYTTSGKTTYEMTHPFGLSRHVDRLLKANTKTVLFHNGVLSEFEHSQKKSDTAIFVKNVLSRVKSLRARISLLESLQGKYALVDREHGIKLIGTFEKYKGCQFSNLHFLNNHKWYTYSDIKYDNYDQDYTLNSSTLDKSLDSGEFSDFCEITGLFYDDISECFYDDDLTAIPRDQLYYYLDSETQKLYLETYGSPDGGIFDAEFQNLEDIPND